MRYRRRSVHRRKLTTRQQRLLEKSGVAELYKDVLCKGVSEHIARCYDFEEFERLRAFINGEVFDAVAAYDRADKAYMASITKRSPRSQNPSTTKRKNGPTKKGKTV